MEPRIRSGELVHVSPELGRLQKDDIVFCKAHGRYYVHLIKAVRGEQFLIGNNRGGTNGWISRTSIFGPVVSIGEEP